MTASPRVLVIDDEPQILRFLRPALTAAGYDVLTAESGVEGLKLAATSAPDLIVLDLGLPDLDGKSVIEQLRTWSRTPVIVLSARDRESEKVAALDLGADDYVNKPFGIGELLARLRTALRHVGNTSAATTIVTVGDVTIDVPAHKVTKSGTLVKLTPKEFDLLQMLARNRGRVVTHRQILTAVWGPAHADDLQYLRVFIGQLRNKLEPAADEPTLIITEPGIGYRLSDDGP
jgi:two-component system KDP operon response regulator KdpE